MTIDVEVPVDGVPAAKESVRRNWRGIVERFTGVVPVGPLLGGFGEALTRPEIEDGVATLDLSRANMHLVRLTEDLQELRFSGKIPEDRAVTCTVRVTQGEPARTAPALDALVWTKGRPELPGPGQNLWVSMITVDGGVTWEAFG